MDATFFISRADLDWLLLVTFGGTRTERLRDDLAIRIHVRAERTGVFLHSLKKSERRWQNPTRAKPSVVPTSKRGKRSASR